MLASSEASTRDRQAPLFFCVGVLLCGLAACAPGQLPRPSPDFVRMYTEQSHTVRFAGEGFDLDEEAQRNLHTFAQDHEIMTVKEIILEGGDPQRKARQTAVLEALRAAGAPKGSITETTETTAAETTSGSQAVVVTLRIETVVPLACIERSKVYPGRLPPGCINQLNLMHMVEDPEDLLRGRNLGSGSAGHAVQARERYEGGPKEP